MRACILTENEEAISDLKLKAEKKKKTEERKKAAAEKKARRKTGARPSRAVEDSDEEAVDDVGQPLELHLDDSSEYSEEVEEDDSWMEVQYPFADKAAEVGDFVRIFFLFFYFCLMFIMSRVCLV